MMTVVLCTLAVGLVSVELGGEFFTALNTALNFAMLAYVHKTRRELTPKVNHIDKVAEVLDTRQEGGQRSYDPPENTP
jgi:hypothetical protein